MKNENFDDFFYTCFVCIVSKRRRLLMAHVAQHSCAIILQIWLFPIIESHIEYDCLLYVLKVEYYKKTFWVNDRAEG